MRYVLVLAVAVLIVAACSAQAPGAPPARATPSPAPRPAAPASLQALLDAEMPAIPAKAGHLGEAPDHRRRGRRRADETFNSASVIKIPVAVQALEMVDAGTLDAGRAH